MKYKILQETPTSEFLVNCPIQLIKSRVMQDVESGICYLNVKYFSMTKKEVETITLKLGVKEEKSRTKTSSTYVFSPDKSTGIMKNSQPFPFLVGGFQNIEILTAKINFKDGSVWNVDKKPIICTSPRKIKIEKLKKYSVLIHREFSYIKKIKYAYSENDHLWRCPCGCVNQEDTCFICGSIKDRTRNFFDKTRIQREYIWWKERTACEESEVGFLQDLEKSKQLSLMFDENLSKIRSQKSSDIGEGIYVIKTLLKEDLFNKKVQAREILEIAEKRFQERKGKEVAFKNQVTSLARGMDESVRVRKARERRMRILITTLTATCASLIVLISATAFIMTQYVMPSWQYEGAYDSFNEGNYQVALDEFEDLGSYKNSETMASESKYQLAIEYANSDKFSTARYLFGELSGYKEAENWLLQVDKMEGEYYMDAGDYLSALNMFALVPDLDGVSTLQNECYYNLGVNAKNSGDNDTALEYFLLANGYSSSESYIVDIIEYKAEQLYLAGDYAGLIDLLEDRTDSFVAGYMSEIVPVYESYARTYYDNGEYAIAKEMYLNLANSTKWLTSSAAISRVTAYPIYCDARLYGNNFADVMDVFDYSYESYNVIEEVPGYMVSYLSGTEWVSYSSTSGVDTSRYISVSSSGYADINLRTLGSMVGYITYSDGNLYVSGDKICALDISSYSSIVITYNSTDYIFVRTS